MLKTYSVLLFFFVALIFSAVKAENSYGIDQELKESVSLAPVVYHMKLVYIFEGGQSEVIFVVGNAGFKSVESLKNWVQNLPSGTTIEFDTTCKRFGNEPLVNSQKEMDDFKEFCKQHNINLVIPRGG